MTYRSWWLGVCLLLLAFDGIAGNARSVRARAESSMQVTGTIVVASDGSVERYALDQPGQLPPGVVKLLGDHVPQWRFKPFDPPGRATLAHARMSVLLVAKQLDAERVQVSVRAASFDSTGPGEAVTAKQMTPPAYPLHAMAMGAFGTVYVVLRVDHDGRVADALVEQVNLRVAGTDAEMNKARDLLARNALVAAKRWTFTPPTAGEVARAPSWSVRVPIDYLFEDGPKPVYGEWITYIPGPRRDAPWIEPEADAAFSPDALVAGGVYTLGDGPRLLTPLDRG